MTTPEVPMAEANSTFASRTKSRLEREAAEGVPPRRKLTLAAGDQAESIFVIEDVDEGGGVSAT